MLKFTSLKEAVDAVEAREAEAEEEYDAYLRSQPRRMRSEDKQMNCNVLILFTTGRYNGTPITFEVLQEEYHFTHRLFWDGSIDHLAEHVDEIEAAYRRYEVYSVCIELRTDTLEWFRRLKSYFHTVTTNREPYSFMEFCLGKEDTSFSMVSNMV